MTEQDHNLPERHGMPPEGVPYDSTYQRRGSDPRRPPRIKNRDMRPDVRCKMCTIVPDLMEGEYVQEEGDSPYSFQQACWVEYDIVTKLYHMWPPDKISKYLHDCHNVDITKRTITRHRNRHIPDVRLHYLDTINQMAKGGMNADVLEDISAFLVLTIDKTKELMAAGAIKPTVANAMEASKIITGLDLQDQRRDSFEAFFDAFDQVLDNHFDQNDKDNIILEIRSTAKQLEAKRDAEKNVQ